MKKLGIEELQESGILQESNRQWFHPLGLALAVVIDRGTVRLEIHDAREDPEGFVFAEGVIDADKCARFEEFADEYRLNRLAKLGFRIQAKP